MVRITVRDAVSLEHLGEVKLAADTLMAVASVRASSDDFSPAAAAAGTCTTQAFPEPVKRRLQVVGLKLGTGRSRL